ncbi:hypothetical protein FLONG3_10610 [Fusarium longipes]|uniref:Heterokaryon incompatibility domain-containing protein n=1 Tax=Fusarium longipes TaxID=694270 RepID=A0A395RMG2_9HYPO|nr:hypothetical protein FLONG3_10610 [Fusarium longipes]
MAVATTLSSRPALRIGTCIAVGLFFLVTLCTFFFDSVSSPVHFAHEKAQQYCGSSQVTLPSVTSFVSTPTPQSTSTPEPTPEVTRNCEDPYRRPGYLYIPTDKKAYRDTQWIPFTEDYLNFEPPEYATYPPTHELIFNDTAVEPEFLNTEGNPQQWMRMAVAESRRRHKEVNIPVPNATVDDFVNMKDANGLGWLWGRRVVMFGDSVDRYMTQFFCEEFGGKINLPIQDITARQAKGLCEVPAFNLTLIYYHSAGSFTYRPDWWWIDNMKDVAWEERWDKFWKPHETPINGPNGRPDLIFWQNGLWDQKALWLSGKDGHKEGENSMTSSHRKMAWEEVRFVTARIKKIAQRLNIEFGKDVPIMFRALTVHRESGLQDAMMMEMDRLGRAVAEQAGHEMFEWSKLIHLLGNLYQDGLHPGKGPASWLWGNMMLESLARSAGSKVGGEARAPYFDGNNNSRNIIDTNTNTVTIPMSSSQVIKTRPRQDGKLALLPTEILLQIIDHNGIIQEPPEDPPSWCTFPPFKVPQKPIAWTNFLSARDIKNLALASSSVFQRLSPFYYPAENYYAFYSALKHSDVWAMERYAKFGAVPNMHWELEHECTCKEYPRHSYHRPIDVMLELVKSISVPIDQSIEALGWLLKNRYEAYEQKIVPKNLVTCSKRYKRARKSTMRARLETMSMPEILIHALASSPERDRTKGIYKMIRMLRRHGCLLPYNINIHGWEHAHFGQLRYPDWILGPLDVAMRSHCPPHFLEMVLKLYQEHGVQVQTRRLYIPKKMKRWVGWSLPVDNCKPRIFRSWSQDTDLCKIAWNIFHALLGPGRPWVEEYCGETADIFGAKLDLIRRYNFATSVELDALYAIRDALNYIASIAASKGGLDMDSDGCQYQIALVAPLRQDYDTAALLLQDKCCEHSVKNSGSTITLGRIGSHHVVLAGNGRDGLSTSHFVNNTVNDLLIKFPFIRVGFLIGVDAIAPEDGIAKTGNIVVGTPQGLEPGVVQFDAYQTTHLNRLSATRQMSRPPYAVQYAVDSLRSEPGRQELQEKLFNGAMAICNTAAEEENLTWSRSVKTLHGKIASSQEQLPRDAVLNKTARDSKVLCFEQAAAMLKPQLPFLTICGVTKSVNAFDASLEEQRSGMAAVIYAILIISKVNPKQLEKHHVFNNLSSYEPFGLERPGFRLIQLERGTQYPLRCNLFQAYLDEEDSIIPYEALSYVWGLQGTPCEIVVDGKVMFITASLFDALCHLRQTDEDRILWVDALCIDQSNIKERSHQVNHMGEIYRKADNVIIWLGYMSGDATIFKTVVDQFSKQLPPEAFRKWPWEDQRWRDQWFEVEKRLGISDNTSLINGLSIFMESPWFTRVWVLQEVANAKRAIIECNLGKIPSKLFAMLPHLVGSPVSEQCQAVLDIMPGPSKDLSWWSQDRNLGTLLCKFKGSEASDPRDRVYALLGMASDTAIGAIEADYTKEETVIVQDLCYYLYGQMQPIGTSPNTSIQILQSQLSAISTRLLGNALAHNPGTDRLLAFLNKQGMMMKIDYNQVHALLDHGDVAIGIYLNKCESPFPINLEIAERTLSRIPDVFDIFLQRQYVPPVLMRSIVSWMIKTNHHGLVGFLKSVKVAIDPGSELIEDLMTYIPTDLTRHLTLVFGAFQEPMILDENLFIRAINESSITLSLLLQHCRRPVTVTEKILAFATAAGPETLKFVLNASSNTIIIRESTFEVAVTQGSATLQTLLGQRNFLVVISDQLLRKAMEAGRNTLEMVLQKSSGIPKQTDGSVFTVAAARGEETLRLLFDHCHDPVHSARKAIYSAVEYGPRTLQSMFNTCPYKIELDEDLFAHALRRGPPTLKSLFEHCIRPIRVDQSMQKAAIKDGIPILEVLYENWASDIETTELITKKASVASPQALTDLINKSGSKIQITDNIIEQSKAVPINHSKLLELRKSERDVAEQEAVQAIQSGPEAFLELFNRPGINFRLTEPICQVARKHPYAFQVLLKKRPSEMFKTGFLLPRSESFETDFDVLK